VLHFLLIARRSFHCYRSAWNQSSCNRGSAGVKVFSPSLEPEVCTSGSIGYYEGATVCYVCPGGEKSCEGGDVCGEGRVDPSTLCIKCEDKLFKAMGDSCEPCGAGNLLETVFGFGGLIVVGVIGYKVISEEEGYFFLVSIFDFVQLFLLITSLGLTLSSGGGGKCYWSFFFRQRLLFADSCSNLLPIPPPPPLLSLHCYRDILRFAPS
jgi:hypothetical protein